MSSTSDELSLDEAEELLQQLGLNYSLTEEIELQFNPHHTYEILHRSERERFREALKSNFSEAAVTDFVDLSYDWKEGSYSDAGQTLERIFDQALDIDCNERNGSLNGREPRENEVDIAKHYYLLSSEYLQDHFGEEISIYRGIGHEVAQIAVELLDNYGQEEHELILSKLDNFSTDRLTAEEYGLLIIACEAEISSVALAADYVIPYKRESIMTKSEAELRIRGDHVRTVESDRITPPDIDSSLEGLLEEPLDLSINEHDVVARVIEKIYESDNYSLNTTEGKQIVTNWYSSYAKASPENALSLREAYTGVVGSGTESDNT